jgi:hypothetical protein
VTSYPTITISISNDRAAKLAKVLRALRDEDDTISRSEAVGRAIDSFFLIICPTDMSNDLPNDHPPADCAAASN